MSPVNFLQTRYNQLDIARNNCANTKTQECTSLLQAGHFQTLGFLLDDIANDEQGYLSMYRGFTHSFMLSFVPAIYYHTKNYVLEHGKTFDFPLFSDARISVWLNKFSRSGSSKVYLKPKPKPASGPGIPPPRRTHAQRLKEYLGSWFSPLLTFFAAIVAKVLVTLLSYPLTTARVFAQVKTELTPNDQPLPPKRIVLVDADPEMSGKFLPSVLCETEDLANGSTEKNNSDVCSLNSAAKANGNLFYTWTTYLLSILLYPLLSLFNFLTDIIIWTFVFVCRSLFLDFFIEAYTIAQLDGFFSLYGGAPLKCLQNAIMGAITELFKMKFKIFVVGWKEQVKKWHQYQDHPPSPTKDSLTVTEPTLPMAQTYFQNVQQSKRNSNYTKTNRRNNYNPSKKKYAGQQKYSPEEEAKQSLTCAQEYNLRQKLRQNNFQPENAQRRNRQQNNPQAALGMSLLEESTSEGYTAQFASRKSKNRKGNANRRKPSNEIANNSAVPDASDHETRAARIF